MWHLIDTSQTLAAGTTNGKGRKHGHMQTHAQLEVGKLAVRLLYSKRTSAAIGRIGLQKVCSPSVSFLRYHANGSMPTAAG